MSHTRFISFDHDKITKPETVSSLYGLVPHIYSSYILFCSAFLQLSYQILFAISMRLYAKINTRLYENIVFLII